MAHFARLDDQNKVTQVIVVNNAEVLDPDTGHESESLGINFCQLLFGKETKWVQTSYSGSIRKNFAGIGSTYDSNRDAFITPQPFSSWILNEDTCQWEPPVPCPIDGKQYYWDEDTKSWLEIAAVQ